jgi:uncharacterized protein YndB with AHSA1/START domain
MREHWVHVERDFSAPVEEVFAHLAEHENLAALFGAKVKRLSDGDTERNGVGSRRELRVNPVVPPFEETVTQYVPNELIEYKITKGSPLDGHVGIMKFSSTGAGTHFDYRIRIASKIPLIGAIVSKQLTRDITKGLAGVPGGR